MSQALQVGYFILSEFLRVLHWNYVANGQKTVLKYSSLLF